MLGVVPVLIGPLQVLLAMLPAIAIAVFSTIISLLKPSAVKTMLRLLWRLKVQVALIAVLVIGLWWGLSAVWPARPPRRNVDAPVETGGDWPLFRGNLARTGALTDSEDPTGGEVRWRYTRGDEAYLSSPAVVGNRVYFTTARIRLGGGQGELVCLDADTGETVWKASQPEDYDATFSSPVIQGDYLVVGEGLHTTNDARILCYSLVAGHEGEMLWSYQTSSHVESTPVIHDGKVYVGAGDKGGYYCLALTGDGNGHPKVLWHRQGEDYLDAETSLVAHGDRFYAGLGNDGKALVELDAETGRELRRIKMSYPVFSPPAVSDGKLYVGCGNGDFAKTAEQLGLPTGGKLVKVDLKTFTIEWSHDLPDTVLGAPAVADGQVFVGCRNGELFVLTTDGQAIRRHATGSEIVSSPAVGKRTVYVLSVSGVLQAFDTRNGQPVWERVIANAPGTSQFGCISSPAIARGHVYVGTQTDGLVCVGEPGKPVLPAWSSSRGGTLQGSSDSVPLAEAVEFLGQYPASQDGSTDRSAVKASPAIMGRSILVPLAGDANATGLACLSPTDPGVRERWRFSDPLGVHTAPAAIGQPDGGLHRAVLVTGQPGDPGRRMICLDADGHSLWSRPVNEAASGVLFVTPHAIFAQIAGAGKLTALTSNGQHRWTADVGTLTSPPILLDSMLVAPVDGQSPGLVILDEPTGTTLLNRALDASELVDALSYKQRLLVATDRGVLSVDPADPEVAPPPMGPPAGSVVTRNGDALWYVSTDQKLIRLDLTNGQSTAGPDASSQVAPLIVGETLVYVDPNGELRSRPATEKATSRRGSLMVPGGMNWLGRPATPLLSAGGRLYVGFAGWGLCVFGGGR